MWDDVADGPVPLAQLNPYVGDVMQLAPPVTSMDEAFQRTGTGLYDSRRAVSVPPGQTFHAYVAQRPWILAEHKAFFPTEAGDDTWITLDAGVELV